MRSMQRVLNKMPKRKVELSTMDDYKEAKDRFYDLNNEVAEIFNEMEKLKARFQSIDSEWQEANDTAYELNKDMFNTLNELGIEDKADEIFNEGLDLTNSYHGQDRVWNSEGLEYLRS